MAFGKDNAQLANIPSFRALTKAHKDLAPVYDKRRKFIDFFKPVMGAEAIPDILRVLPGLFNTVIAEKEDGRGASATYFLKTIQTPYYSYVEHFHQVKQRSTICTGGPLYFLRDRREPCRGCDVYDMEYLANRATRQKPNMGRRVINAMNVLHYALYAEQPKIDKRTGKPMVGQDSKPILNWEPVPQHIANQIAQTGGVLKLGMVLPWALGSGHFNQLFATANDIGRSCLCGGRGTISTDFYACSTCGETLIDVQTTHFSPEEISNMVDSPVTCANCKAVGVLDAHLVCKSCGNPRPAELWDVDLEARRIPSAVASQGSQTLLSLNFSDAKPIDAQFNEALKTVPNLSELLAPTPLEEQNETWADLLAGSPAAAQSPVTRAYTAPVLGGGNVPYGGNK